ncbi:hypothetical protein D3C71_513490 [compost metagenome]
MFVFVVVKLIQQYIQEASLNYARSAQPLDPEMGWRREDVQLAFIAGAEHQAALRITAPEPTEALAEQS